MKVRYKREMRHNYLILEAFEQDAESFEIRMLTGNSIDGLLKFRMKQEEQNQYYYYEITSKQPLSRLLEFKEIRREELGRLIIGIGSALHRMEDFLLQESHILLEPEHIYIEPETYQIWLCYVPGYQGDFPAAMEKLLQYLLKKADHRDNETVVLAYRLYQESQKDYYGIEDLLRAVQESQCSIYEKELEPEPAGENDAFGHDQQQKKRQESMWESENNLKEKGIKAYRNREKEDLEASEENWVTGKERRKERRKYNRKKSRNGTIENQEKREKNKVKIQGQIENQGAKSLRNDGRNCRKGTKFAGLFLLAFLIAVPAAVWLFSGTRGLVLYGRWIAAADAGAAAGFLAFVTGKRAKRRMPRPTEQRTREDWYMTFEESEPEESVNQKKQNGIRGRQEAEERSGREWTPEMDSQINWKQDRLTSQKIDQQEEWQTNQRTNREIDWRVDRQSDRLETFQTAAENQAAVIQEIQEMGPGRDTVLLASADTRTVQSHLLKSLDPSIEDIPIPYFPFLIGKQEGIVDYVLRKDTVSRLHIRIDEDETGCQITDLNSSNGTIVGGHNLEANESSFINSGDKLQIADLSFVFY